MSCIVCGTGPGGHLVHAMHGTVRKSTRHHSTASRITSSVACTRIDWRSTLAQQCARNRNLNSSCPLKLAPCTFDCNFPSL